MRRASAPATPPDLKATIRNKRSPGARRPCPVVAKRPAGGVFEPMKGKTMNALTKPAERRARSRKVYAGRRGPQGCVVWVIDGNGERKTLNPQRALRDHGPTGFEWGVWRKRPGAAGTRHSGRTPRRRSRCAEPVSGFQVGMHCADTRRQLVAVRRGDRQLPRSTIGTARGHSAPR